MARCYGCKSDFNPEAVASAVLPGLCVPCERRSRAARERLQRLDGKRYGAAHFNAAGVDPPVWKPERPCLKCGVVGQMYGWTQWRFESTSTDSPRPDRVEGDGYLFCMNCETVAVSVWSKPTSPVPSTPLIPPEPLVTTGRNILLGELVFLFILSAMLAAFLF